MKHLLTALVIVLSAALPGEQILGSAKGCSRRYLRRINGKCYYFSVKKMNWHGALNNCLRKGLTLADLSNPRDFYGAIDFLSSKGNTEDFWFGGNDLQHEGRFQYISNGRLVRFFSNYSIVEPAEHSECDDCLEVRIRSNMTVVADDNCLERQYFICSERYCEDTGDRAKPKHHSHEHLHHFHHDIGDSNDEEEDEGLNEDPPIGSGSGENAGSNSEGDVEFPDLPDDANAAVTKPSSDIGPPPPPPPGWDQPQIPGEGIPASTPAWDTGDELEDQAGESTTDGEQPQIPGEGISAGEEEGTPAGDTEDAAGESNTDGEQPQILGEGTPASDGEGTPAEDTEDAAGESNTDGEQPQILGEGTPASDGEGTAAGEEASNPGEGGETTAGGGETEPEEGATPGGEGETATAGEGGENTAAGGEAPTGAEGPADVAQVEDLGALEGEAKLPGEGGAAPAGEGGENTAGGGETAPEEGVAPPGGEGGAAPAEEGGENTAAGGEAEQPGEAEPEGDTKRAAVGENAEAATEAAAAEAANEAPAVRGPIAPMHQLI